MKYRLVAILLLCGIAGSIGCSSNNNSSSTLTIAELYVATAGDSMVQPYAITLTSGALSTDGSPGAIGTSPSAMALSPNLNTMVVADSVANNLSVFTVNGDGTITAAAGNTATGTTPVGLAFNPAGTFLFVVNQGSENISVYAVSGTTLTQVAGSPFSALTPGSTVLPQPSAIAVSPSGNYVYVANTFANTVSMFDVSSSGALTQTVSYSVGLNPVALAVTPKGGFLYVANFSDNNISGFSICDAITTTCANANSPDGSLTPVAGSPFSAGLGPTAMSTDTTGAFLFVADKSSNQVSQFRISASTTTGAGTGALTANNPAAISTGTTPVGVGVVTGSNTITSTGGTFEYLYVPNNGGTSISIYSFDSTLGQLTVVGMPYPTLSGSPSAIAVR